MGSRSSKSRSAKRASRRSMSRRSVSRALRSRKSRLSKSSRKRMLKSKKRTTRRMTKMPRMTVMTTPMFRYRVPMMASVYVPGSEKGRRLTKKGGYTEWQVKTQQIGIKSLRKGKLSNFGYHTYLPKTSRSKSLGKAVKEYGALSTYRSLNALAVYNKNTNPEMAAIAKEDRDMIRAKYM